MELHIRNCRMNEFGCFLLPTWPFSVLFVNPKTIKNKKTNKQVSIKHFCIIVKA